MWFGEAVSHGFANYLKFDGRASRSEFWGWFFFTAAVVLVTLAIDFTVYSAASFSPLYVIASLIFLVPTISAGVRRLHDTDRSGKWALLALTVFGGLVLVYWAILPGTDGDNRYGPDPHVVRRNW